jgi:hypothetical protein
LPTIAIDSAEAVYHILKTTDILRNYLLDSGGKFEFDGLMDFASDYVQNEALVVESFGAIGGYDEPFDVSVRECQGIYFVQANEFDNIAFFLDRGEAVAAAQELAADYQ